ncbi:MAG: iron ABC transporter permease [Bacteroidetes bacterium]|nr:MAG: iron ABC transporter permease [Bacteroidota bacterium]
MKKHLLMAAVLAALLVLVGLAGLATGPYPFSLGDILRVLAGQEVPHGELIIQLRMPRVLLAFITGAVLSCGGFFMQALIKNPLADPYIMGVTAGAGLGVNLLILGLIPIAQFTLFTYPLFAALGAVLSLLVVLVLGFRLLYEDNARLLIAGVAVASLFTAITGVLIYTLADSDEVRRMIFWTFGSLHRAHWPAVYVSACLLLMALLYGFLFARRMDVLLLGDLDARSLGMRIIAFKLSLLLITSLTVGGIVAFTGPIGFVGMMIPHFSRSVLGAAHRPNILLGSLAGGIFLCACDVLSQGLYPPAGLPIGIITAILGVPFFLYVLFSPNTYL